MQTTEEFKENVKSRYGDKVEILSEYMGGTKPIDFLYYCDKHGNIFKTINAKNILAKSFSPCNECTNELHGKQRNSQVNDKMYYYNRLKKYCEDKGGRLITKKWTTARTLYEIKCDNIDHPSFFNTADKIVNSNQWCPYCYGRKGDFEQELRDLISSKNGQLLSKYINTYAHVRVKCNIHNYVWDIMPLNLKKGRWCPVCNMVKNEKITYDCLSDLGLNFDIQYCFDDLIGKNNEKLRFDFSIFINDKIILLEIDGDNHRAGGRYSEKTKKYDKIKNDYCIKNNIDIIRIPYYNSKKPSYDEFYQEVKKIIIKEIINPYNDKDIGGIM